MKRFIFNMFGTIIGFIGLLTLPILIGALLIMFSGYLFDIADKCNVDRPSGAL